MDFLNAKYASARDIALALGVPPMLLGIPGDNTYTNYREANLVFWRQTVVPLVAKTARALSGWLARRWAADLRLEPDLDAIPALSLERESLWRRVSDATFLSDAEKRQAVGYSAAKSAVPAQAGTHNPERLRDGTSLRPTLHLPTGDTAYGSPPARGRHGSEAGRGNAHD